MKRIFLTDIQAEWLKIPEFEAILAKEELMIKRASAPINIFRFSPDKQDFSIRICSTKPWRNLKIDIIKKLLEEYQLLLDPPLSISRVQYYNGKVYSITVTKEIKLDNEE